MIRVLQVAGAFVALLIGSGFATGQEAIQFFAVYGLKGLLGAVITLVLFIYVCNSLLNLGRREQLRTNQEVFTYYCGKPLGLALTWYTVVFIVAVHSVMVAGAAATLNQAYEVPGFLGAALLVGLCAITILLGLNRILEVIGAIGPIIILLTIATATLSLIQESSDITVGEQHIQTLDLLRASPYWFFSGLLYVGLILPALAGFLPAVGITMASKGQIRAAAVLGPALFVGTLIVVVLALLGAAQISAEAEIPIMVLAANVLPIYGSIFAVVVFLGVFSTITPLLWTVCTRFANAGSPKFRNLAIGLNLVGLVGGTLLPFGELLNLIYPTVGYVGLFVLLSIIYKDLQRLKKSPQ